LLAQGPRSTGNLQDSLPCWSLELCSVLKNVSWDLSVWPSLPLYWVVVRTVKLIFKNWKEKGKMERVSENGWQFSHPPWPGKFKFMDIYFACVCLSFFLSGFLFRAHHD
jgi:hypothetical protein